jgi:hypothetical protein
VAAAQIDVAIEGEGARGNDLATAVARDAHDVVRHREPDEAH